MRISTSIIIALLAILIIWTPTWFNRFSKTHIVLENATIPPAFVEVATHVNGQLDQWFFSPHVSIYHRWLELATVFLPYPIRITQQSNLQLAILKLSDQSKPFVRPLSSSHKTVQSHAWFTQGGSFSTQESANEMKLALKRIQLHSMILKKNGRFEIVVGPFDTKAQAQTLLETLNYQFRIHGRVIQFNTDQFDPDFLPDYNQASPKLRVSGGR